VPDSPPVPSQRVRTVARGTFLTGTVGSGFISWCPRNPTNDVGSIRYSSGAGYAGDNFGTSLTAGVTTTTKTNLPYVNNDFKADGDFLQARLVGSGMRIRNITPDLYASGIVYGCRVAPENALEEYTSDEVKQNPVAVVADSKSFGPTDWKTLVSVPYVSEDYSLNEGPVDWANDTLGRLNLGFLVSGCDTSHSNTFEWELVEFWEFVGSNSSQNLPGVVLSYSDPVGLARVLDGIQVTSLDLSQKRLANQVASTIIGNMAHSDSAAKTVEDILGLAGMALPVVASLTKTLGAFLLL